MNIINYRKAEFDDVKNIAQVHIESFPETFISSLGINLISNYYLEFLKENSPFIVAEYKGKILGFCMGYYGDTFSKRNFIQNNKYRLVAHFALSCIKCNRQYISRIKDYLPLLFKKQGNNGNNKPQGDISAHLLSICVIDEYKGQGVAKKLIELFELDLKKLCVFQYNLSVSKSNIRAISFYKKMNLDIKKENELEYIMSKCLKD